MAREQAQRNDVESRIELVVSAAESLPYDDASFDLAFGKAVSTMSRRQLGQRSSRGC